MLLLLKEIHAFKLSLWLENLKLRFHIYCRDIKFNVKYFKTETKDSSFLYCFLTDIFLIIYENKVIS